MPDKQKPDVSMHSIRPLHLWENVNTCSIPVCTLGTSFNRVYTNGYSVCLCHLWLLGNGGVSECYTASPNKRFYFYACFSFNECLAQIECFYTITLLLMFFIFMFFNFTQRYPYVYICSRMCFGSKIGQYRLHDC